MQNFSFSIQVYQLHMHIWGFLNKSHMKTICGGCWYPRAAGKLGIQGDFFRAPHFSRVFSQSSLAVRGAGGAWAELPCARYAV